MTCHYRFALASTLFAIANHVTISSYNGIKSSASKINQHVFLQATVSILTFFSVAFGVVELIFFKFTKKMNAAPKVGDIEEEDNILTTKIKLTKNEYNATIRNKLEYNRLKVITRHITDQNDLNACRSRTSMHDLRKWLDENQRVVCNIDEFFMNRKVRFSYFRIILKIFL
jgi:hypothetical protein